MNCAVTVNIVTVCPFRRARLSGCDLQIGGMEGGGCATFHSLSLCYLRMYNQARIDTGFRRFTKLAQIFNKKFMFLVKNFKLSELKSGKWFGQSANILSE